jgi:hypothetical protein
MPAVWSVPPLWKGEAAVLMATGPSLTLEDVDYCRGKARVLVVNDNYRLAPWADLHYFCDHRWWDWHKDRKEYKVFEGLRVKLLKEEEGDAQISGVKFIKNKGWGKTVDGNCTGLCSDPTGVYNGKNSGYQAINLAAHLGVKRMLLLGYDMKAESAAQSHWFGDHPVVSSWHSYKAWAKHFDSLVPDLKARGIEVVNCTPGSALTCFPRAELRDALV